MGVYRCTPFPIYRVYNVSLPSPTGLHTYLLTHTHTLESYNPIVWVCMCVYAKTHIHNYTYEVYNVYLVSARLTRAHTHYIVITPYGGCKYTPNTHAPPYV